jgi:hypothetical protein
MLNTDTIPDYLKKARLTLLSKNGKTTASLDDIRPIAVLPQIMKVLEKAIKNKYLRIKVVECRPILNWVPKGSLNKTQPHRHAQCNNEDQTKRSQRKIYIAVDLSKA